MLTGLALLLTVGQVSESAANSSPPPDKQMTLAEFEGRPANDDDVFHWLGARYDYGATVSRYGLGYAVGPMSVAEGGVVAGFAAGLDLALSTRGHHRIDATQAIVRMQANMWLLGVEAAFALGYSDKVHTSVQFGPTLSFIFVNIGVLLEAPVVPIARPNWMPPVMFALRINYPLNDP